jgi:hypothetical protein
MLSCFGFVGRRTDVEALLTCSVGGSKLAFLGGPNMFFGVYFQYAPFPIDKRSTHLHFKWRSRSLDDHLPNSKGTQVIQQSKYVVLFMMVK